MAPVTPELKTPRRSGRISITASDKRLQSAIESPGSENLQLPTPKRRKRKAGAPQEDEFMQFARSLVADDTESALRVAGCSEVSTEAASDGQWCVCGIAEEDMFDLESVIRCDNRQACNVGEVINGLICQRGEDGAKEVRDWLQEETEKLGRQRKRRQLKRQKKKLEDLTKANRGDIEE
ncbi:hypothetical protein PRZ48_013706 [Zasmidium cellare]|uniref:Uncharacterized protein n=1 Tax=Zasmidium cellare TaxID=395010 RepID=A0ABR0E1U7_ZASCE|nr:hypothetical protein PRZ48_013706 [Zasmidium cellare]